MTCLNCHDDDCDVANAELLYDHAWRQYYGYNGYNEDFAGSFKAASERLVNAQNDCQHRAAYPSTVQEDRMAAIEARLDRIEAALAVIECKL